jgi:hypothetical protein
MYTYTAIQAHLLIGLNTSVNLPVPTELHLYANRHENMYLNFNVHICIFPIRKRIAVKSLEFIKITHI